MKVDANRGTHWMLLRRATALDTRQFSSYLGRHGVRLRGYAICHQAIYLGLFGRTSDELKNELDVTNVRDGLNEDELRALDIAMGRAVKLIEQNAVQGDVPCAQTCLAAAHATAMFLYDTAPLDYSAATYRLSQVIEKEGLTALPTDHTGHQEPRDAPVFMLPDAIGYPEDESSR